MSAATSIEWCHATVNWWAGCTAVSPACDNCYAKAMAGRLWGTEWGTGKPRHQFAGAADTLRALDHKAKRLGRPLRVFHNSLSDFFDNEVPVAWRINAMWAIANTPNLIHLLLTKRIGNAHSMLNEAVRNLTGGLPTWWNAQAWPHVWIGATMGNQEEVDRDITKLLAVPAAKRFLSMEPLLGPVTVFDLDGPIDVPDGMKSPLDWVICGFESGPKARPGHPDWVRSLRDQSVHAGVPFFFKQWGEYHPSAEHDHYAYYCLRTPEAVHVSGAREYRPSEQFRLIGTDGWAGMCRLGKKAAGRELDGRTWDEVPV